MRQTILQKLTMRIANTTGHVIGGSVLLCGVLIAGSLALGEDAKQTAAVVVGRQAHQLEQYAADELCDYLRKLYGIQVRPTSEASPDAEVVLLIGSPKTNPAVAEAVGDDAWPVLSDQGLVLKPVRVSDRPALVVGGGSPKATMWAVYELVERWGVRYLLHGDVFPEEPGALQLPTKPVVMEPVLRVRQWRVVNDFACGPTSWGMADYRPVLDQLAKLKFNRIFASIFPQQPFLDLKIKGISRRSAHLWYGRDWHYPITDDMPGRHLFGDATEFWNPDLPLGASYEKLSAAGEKLVHNLMDHAHRRGMRCVITADLFHFPLEFEPLLKDTGPTRAMFDTVVMPGAATRVGDPRLTEMAVAVLRTTVKTYPEVDYVAVTMPEFRRWAGQYQQAWQALDAKHGISKTRSLEALLAAARQRTGYPGGAERAVQEVKGDLVALQFLDRLLSDPAVLQDMRQAKVRLIVSSVAEELYPLLKKLLPPGSETINFIDYTPSRVVRRREAIGHIDNAIPAVLVYTLHDDNIGVLPQLTTGSLHELTKDLRRHGWAGFTTRYWMISDHEPCVAYIAKAAWDETATPESVYRDQIGSVCGQACVPDMLEMFRQLEHTTMSLEDLGLWLSFPVPYMFTKHHMHPCEIRGWMVEVREGYRRALVAARAAAAKSRPAGKVFAEYWVGRLEFGVGYFDCIEATRRAMTLKAEGKEAAAVAEMNRAVDLSRSMLESYARVAADQSDRGAIATMAEYVYRPLKAKAEQWSKD